MPTEIEKKYRLTPAQRLRVEQSLKESPAVFISEDFEENTLYAGGTLDEHHSVLRVRRTRQGAVLTFKTGVDTDSGIKQRREEESRVDNAEAIESILEAVGFNRRMVYEKRRLTWNFESVEVVIDELPFGNYMEIEGPVEGIVQAEKRLRLEDLEVEHFSYPKLTMTFGKRVDDRTEARFNEQV
jgi:adenylate cyclase class 2